MEGDSERCTVCHFSNSRLDNTPSASTRNPPLIEPHPPRRGDIYNPSRQLRRQIFLNSQMTHCVFGRIHPYHRVVRPYRTILRFSLSALFKTVDSSLRTRRLLRQNRANFRTMSSLRTAFHSRVLSSPTARRFAHSKHDPPKPCPKPHPPTSRSIITSISNLAMHNLFYTFSTAAPKRCLRFTAPAERKQQPEPPPHQQPTTTTKSYSSGLLSLLLQTKNAVPETFIFLCLNIANLPVPAPAQPQLAAVIVIKHNLYRCTCFNSLIPLSSLHLADSVACC